MLASWRLFRIAGRENDMAFLIPISHMIPVLPAQSAAVVDARDVAEAMWLAAQKGRRGER